MSEGAMWEALRPVLREHDPVRIESPITPGCPDVNVVEGWIELKYAKCWPKRGGPLRLDHYTQEQRVWAVKRRAAGGLCWLLLKVGKDEWLLFDGRVAAALVGRATQQELYQACLARWTRLPKTTEMSTCLQGHR